MTDALCNAVLTTVNASYRVPVDVDDFVQAIRSCDAQRAQVGSFLTEVPTAQQLAFANEVGLTRGELVRAARAYQDWSGRDVPFAA